MCDLQQVSICVFHGKLLMKPVFPLAESALPSLPVLLSFDGESHSGTPYCTDLKRLVHTVSSTRPLVGCGFRSVPSFVKEGGHTFPALSNICHYKGVIRNSSDGHSLGKPCLIAKKGKRV